MKVEDRPPEPPRSPRRAPFRRVLETQAQRSTRTLEGTAPSAPPRAPPQAAPVPAPRAAARTAEPVRQAIALTELRKAQHAHHTTLVADRAEGLAGNEDRTTQRVRELIRQELQQEPPPRAAASPGGPALDASPRSPPLKADAPELAVGGAGATASATARLAAPEAATARTEAILELAERIQLFMKGTRPALSLSVGGALEAEVQVERTGRAEVALTVRGRTKPPGAHQLAAIREALGARGLSLSALRVE